MTELIIKTAWMYGLAIVVALGIAALIKAIVVVLSALEPKPAAAAKPAAATAGAAATDVEADHIAAIAAAVYSLIGAHRIVHIERERRHGEWAVEGRIAHHASHTVAHHPKH
jgi:hypothetical protein